MVVLPVRVTVGMSVAVRMFLRVNTLLFHSIHDDFQMRAADPAPLRRFRLVYDTRDPQRIQLTDHARGIRKKLQERRAEHVAGCAHITFQIQCLHPGLLTPDD